jgi:DNA-binding NarL/FixJ family response regulator
MDGVEATRRIRDEHPEVQVIVLTTYADDASVFAALRAGARGYLTKDAGADEIAGAIARVAAGQAMLDASVQARLLDHLDDAPSENPAADLRRSVDDARDRGPDPDRAGVLQCRDR